MPRTSSGAKCALDSIIYFISSLHILFVCYYASPLILFSLLFLSYLLPYLSFPLRIEPLHFLAGCLKGRLNLAVVFCVYFVLQFLLIGKCVLLLC